MNRDPGFNWEVPEIQHRVRVASAMVAAVNGQPILREVGEYVEGWDEVQSVLVPRAINAFRSSDEELARFLIGRGEPSPYN